MVTLLRDNFEYSVSARTDLESLERIITNFTDEQFESLDLLEDNERVLFKGPAGTGKTFLAIEAAKRAINDGKSVLLICYNRLLGEWLKCHTSTFSDSSKSFKCGTFHSLLLEILNIKPLGLPTPDFWSMDLPIRAVDLLLDDKNTWPVYDMLVIDEAQDLLSEEYLDVLDLLIKGGLAGGRWAFFGDFERQAIYINNCAKGLESLTERAPRHSKFSLRVNCRNSRQIAETLSLTSGLSPGYRKVLHDIEGSDVEPIFYSSNTDQTSKLSLAVNELKKIFKSGEIVVLSMKSDKKSCVGESSSVMAGIRFSPFDKVQDGNTIPFTSIHAYKGLEAPAIIITDIDDIDDDKSRALLYIGMSRARIRLFMLMHESCRKSYIRLLDAGLLMTSRA
jgi:hypothetical protein